MDRLEGGPRACDPVSKREDHPITEDDGCLWLVGWGCCWAFLIPFIALTGVGGSRLVIGAASAIFLAGIAGMMLRRGRG